ncbi:hypothetical protein ABT117_31150 [Streptomyces sp. NPDC002262]|uniref:hypothetical protein n=1 Tax=Streptomyces sp. NPDC002262 TaxID=3154414 RepID=UPI00332B3ABC
MTRFRTERERVLAQREADGWLFLIDTASLVVGGASRRLFKDFTAWTALTPSYAAPRTVLLVGDCRWLTRVAKSVLRKGDELHILSGRPSPGRAGKQSGLDTASPQREDRCRVLRVSPWQVQVLGRYDAIVCDLPLHSYPPQSLMSMFQGLHAALAVHAKMTFVMRRPRPGRSPRAAHQAVVRHRVLLQLLAALPGVSEVGTHTSWCPWPVSLLQVIRDQGGHMPSDRTAAATRSS